MIVSRWCRVCQANRSIDISKAYEAGKKRIICGHCGTVLMEEQELENIVHPSYNYGC